jgi:prepilin-type N-terminal cleavage/methylation domain-containing protein
LTRDDGFTLIETLVALVLTSLVLAALYATLGGGMRRLAEFNRREITVAYAQSHLDRLVSSRSLQAGESTGTYPDLTNWRLSARRLATSGTFEDISAQPFHVTLEVATPEGRPLMRIETVALSEGTP